MGKLIQLILNTLEALILAAMLLELLEVNPEKNKNSENLHEHRVWEPICILEQKFILKLFFFFFQFSHRKHFCGKIQNLTGSAQCFQLWFSFSQTVNGKRKTREGNVTFCVFLTDGYESAKSLCDLYYMSSPELVLEELNSKWMWGEALSWM